MKKRWVKKSLKWVGIKAAENTVAFVVAGCLAVVSGLGITFWKHIKPWLTDEYSVTGWVFATGRSSPRWSCRRCR